jgi:hypothetical protein
MAVIAHFKIHTIAVELVLSHKITRVLSAISVFVNGNVNSKLFRRNSALVSELTGPFSACELCFFFVSSEHKLF